MALRKSKQPLLVTSLNLTELNDVFQRVQDELDRLNGLHGEVVFHDDLVIENDASAVSTVLTFEGMTYVDSNEETLHSFGA